MAGKAMDIQPFSFASFRELLSPIHFVVGQLLPVHCAALHLLAVQAKFIDKLLLVLRKQAQH